MKIKPFPRLILIIVVVGGIAFFIKRANDMGMFASVPTAESQPATQAVTPPQSPPSSAREAAQPAQAESPVTTDTANPGLEKLLSSGSRK